MSAKVHSNIMGILSLFSVAGDVLMNHFFAGKIFKPNSLFTIFLF